MIDSELILIQVGQTDALNNARQSYKLGEVNVIIANGQVGSPSETDSAAGEMRGMKRRVNFLERELNERDATLTALRHSEHVLRNRWKFTELYKIIIILLDNNSIVDITGSISTLHIITTTRQ